MVRTLLLPCCVVLVLLTLARAAVAVAEPVEGPIVPPHVLPSVLEWTVHDVEHWMNYTLGYPEYSGHIRKHRVDGPTLIEMEPADFESFFPVENPLHVVKFKAHTKLLQGRCSCYNTDAADLAPLDFWEHFKQHSVRTWLEGGTALFFPRVAMLSAYLFDKETYAYLTSVSVERAAALGGDQAVLSAVSTVRIFFYWLSFLVGPDVFLAYQSARLVPANYFIMSCFVIHFIAQAFNEYMLLFMLYRGTAFDANMGYLQRIRVMFSYTLAVPVVGLVVGYLFPTFLQYVCLGGLVLHNFLIIIGFLFLYVRDPGESMKAEAEGPTHTPQKSASNVQQVD